MVASAGCGSAMKEYSDLLRGDPQYRDKADRFSGMTVDVTEFLVSLPFDPPKGEVRRRITYQDSCHLAHAQRITAAPRAILNSIPELDFTEMENASQCCGRRRYLFHNSEGALPQAPGEQDEERSRHWGRNHSDGQPRLHNTARDRPAADRHPWTGVPRSRYSGRGLPKRGITRPYSRPPLDCRDPGKEGFS